MSCATGTRCARRAPSVRQRRVRKRRRVDRRSDPPDLEGAIITVPRPTARSVPSSSRTTPRRIENELRRWARTGARLGRPTTTSSTTSSSRPLPGVGGASREVPGRPHGALGRIVDADALRRRRRDRAGLRDVHVARSSSCHRSVTAADPLRRCRRRRRSHRIRRSTPGRDGCSCRSFSVQAVAKYEQDTRELCNQLIDGFVDTGRADAAADYAQQIPVRVIATMLGVTDRDPTSSRRGFAACSSSGSRIRWCASRIASRSSATSGSRSTTARPTPDDDLITDLLTQRGRRRTRSQIRTSSALAT